MATLGYNFKRLTAQGSADNTPKGLTTMLVDRRQSAMAKPSLPENRFYVYVLRRPDKEDPLAPGRGCPFYVGKGNNGRVGNHRLEAARLLRKPGRKSHKNNVIHKLWRGGLDFEEEVILEGLTEKKAHEIEQEIIKTYGRENNGTGVLSNLTNGGDGVCGLIHSEETRKGLSKTSKTAWSNPEYRQKNIETSKKTRSDPKYRKKNSENLKTIWANPDYRERQSEAHKGNPNPNKGKTGIYSEETIQKIREARAKQVSPMKGRKHTEDAKARMSESRKGKTAGENNPNWKGKSMTAETRRKQSEAHSGEKHCNYGKHLPEETRQKIGDAHRGRPCPEERKQKLREANLGKKASPETKAKMSSSQKGKRRTEEAKQNMRAAWEIRRASKGLGETF